MGFNSIYLYTNPITNINITAWFCFIQDSDYHMIKIKYLTPLKLNFN